MNPESEAVTALVEATTVTTADHRPQEMYEQRKPIGRGGWNAIEWTGTRCTCGWKPKGVRTGEFYEHQTLAVLSAALTATEDEECGECGGTAMDMSKPEGDGVHYGPCSHCNGSGRVPGKPLIIGAAIEAGIDVVDALVKLGVLFRTELPGLIDGAPASVAAYVATRTEEG